MERRRQEGRPDPYYGDTRDFERAFKLVDAAAMGVVERIRQQRY